MISLLKKLERALQNAIEGSPALMAKDIQPLDLVRQIQREIESNKRVFINDQSHPAELDFQNLLEVERPAAGRERFLSRMHFCRQPENAGRGLGRWATICCSIASSITCPRMVTSSSPAAAFRFNWRSRVRNRRGVVPLQLKPMAGFTSAKK